MTDNITLQARTPMTTEEIIGLLETVKTVYPVALGNAVAEEEIAAELEALTAGIQAVELLEQIKAELHNKCCACTHHDCPTYEDPCWDCLGDGGDHWAFRRPLEEETDHENK